MGIEPTSPAWKAGALPLCYARIRVRCEAILPSPQRQSSNTARPSASRARWRLQVDRLRREGKIQTGRVESLFDLQIDFLQGL